MTHQPSRTDEIATQLWEELLSLVYFYECDAHTRVESLPAPVGRV